MTQNEMDREIDQIKQVISFLARRKYICKSELRKILSGCRANTFSLMDIESLMYSVIDKSVIYVDDTETSDQFHSCIVIQNEIKKAGYTDLFQLLSVDKDSTLLEITEAYNRIKNDATDSDLYAQIGLLIESDNLLDIYRGLCMARDIFYEFSLRKQFGLFSITENEKRRMINSLVVSSNMTPSAASNLIESCMFENDIVISDEKGMALLENQDDVLDEFLIPLQNNSEQNKKDRGSKNGRY